MNRESISRAIEKVAGIIFGSTIWLIRLWRGVPWGTVYTILLKTLAVLLLLTLLIVSAYLGGEWLWWRLSNYIQPTQSTEKKDLVNVFVLIAGGVIAFLTASTAIGNLYVSRRNLYQQRELDERRAQDEALQAYYEQIGNLLIKHNLRGLDNNLDPVLRRRDNNLEPVRSLAQAQTLTLLRRVDAPRKGDLVRFLCGAQLITGENPIIHLRHVNIASTSLSGADLSGADLQNADLSRTALRDTDLRGADLSYANLQGANLELADLRSANLTGATLSRTNLNYAKLRGADLSYATLLGAYGDYYNLHEAKLLYTMMPNGREGFGRYGRPGRLPARAKQR
jgi:uncharacterized protein YjbI with pentapeptide repeats